MESLIAPPRAAQEAAKQIIDEGERNGVTLRLLGGVAFKVLCKSAFDPRFYRENKDIDLAGKRSETKAIVQVLEGLGYRPREVFNKLNMGQRLIYYDLVNKRRVDVFLDQFAMCHRFNLRHSLLPGQYTLPITDLVMTKLQVVEMTDKEYKDLCAALIDFGVGETEETINKRRIADVCSKDWGLYTTFKKSLISLSERANSLNGGPLNAVTARVAEILTAMEEEPKSLSWKLRAKIGEGVRWYELPETDSDPVLA